jgi:tetratricopeptide (TPR) repeat protein
MADISLRVYLSDLERLLESNAADEVILHSRHILQYYPKNAAAYRQLGRALILNGRWEEAEAALRRVLAVIPDDYRAHLGLSEIYDHKRRGDEAIWHLERALEQEPNNRQVIDQMRSLYKRYRNIDQGKIPLTAAAVARQAMNNHAYEQAIETLRQALNRQPDRTDLRLLLAQALWSGGDPVEAAEAALDVLQALPDCLAANRILTELWLQEDRPSDAQKYLSRVEAVEPYVAVELATGQRADDNAFRLPESDVRLTAQSEMTMNRPDWLQDIPDTVNTGDTSTGDLSDWGQTSRLLPRTGTLGTGALGTGGLSQPVPPATPEEEDELKALFSTDYLRSLNEGAPEQAAQTPAFSTGSLFEAGDLTAAAASQDMPEWMSAATQQVPLSPQQAPQDDPMAWLGDGTDVNAEAEFLAEAGSDDPFADQGDINIDIESDPLSWLGGSVDESAVAAETPDWMQDPDPLARRERFDVIPSPADVEPVTDMPDIDWLTGDDQAQTALDEALGLEALSGSGSLSGGSTYEEDLFAVTSAGGDSGVEALAWLSSSDSSEEVVFDEPSDISTQSEEFLTSSDTSLSRPTQPRLTDILNQPSAEAMEEQAAAEDDAWLQEVSNEPAGVPGPKKGLTALLNDANFDWVGDTGSLQAAAASESPSDDWLGQFDTDSADVTDEPEWLSDLQESDDSEISTFTAVNEPADELGAEMESEVESQLQNDDDTKQVPIAAASAVALGMGAALALDNEPDNAEIAEGSEPTPDTSEIDVEAILQADPTYTGIVAPYIEEDENPFEDAFDLETAQSEAGVVDITEVIALESAAEIVGEQSASEADVLVVETETVAIAEVADLDWLEEVESDLAMEQPASEFDILVSETEDAVAVESADLDWLNEVESDLAAEQPASEFDTPDMEAEDVVAAEVTTPDWVNEIDEDGAGVETISFAAMSAAQPDELAIPVGAAAITDFVNTMDNDNTDIPVSPDQTSETSDWLFDAEAEAMTDEEANAILPAADGDWLADSGEPAGEFAAVIAAEELVADELDIDALFAQAGIEDTAEPVMAETDIDAMFAGIGDSDNGEEEAVALEPADAAELAALFADTPETPAVDVETLFSDMGEEIGIIESSLQSDTAEVDVDEIFAEPESAAALLDGEPIDESWEGEQDEFGADDLVLPAIGTVAVAAALHGEPPVSDDDAEWLNDEPDEEFIEAVASEELSSEDAESAYAELEEPSDVDVVAFAEAADEDVFDQMESAEIIESDPEVAIAAENAPDWLNALVPGLDVDFEAAEDEPVESEFLAPEPEQVIGVEEGDTSEFAWVDEIIALETREAVGETALAPNTGFGQPRFKFSRQPLWFHAAVNGASNGFNSTPAVDADDDLVDWS